ncbi:MAG: tRNA (adenosine(37)-N6)-dimethylallyltransferase MiaA, partial [Chromatiales bacterium]|nr:tRNA (adenosine(37)-N6)-dimethylallyltransferase MiaA [Chromatiales bacterium]
MGGSILCIMGPTAAGKTALALALAQRFGIEIVSVDSALVYRGLDIGSGKPTTAERESVPHHLIDIREPCEAYSAAAFAADASEAIKGIWGRGRLPVLVGGTGLYFRGLLTGFSALPSADADLRKRLEDDAERLGWRALHDRLRSLDPVTAERLHPNDAQRIQRALEIAITSGKPMSEQLARRRPALQVRALRLVVAPSDRSVLHDRISSRFDTMLADGLVKEVRSLRSRPCIRRDLPAMRSVGYRQVWDYLEGELPFAVLADKGKAATRQLARRQLTWLRA